MEDNVLFRTVKKLLIYLYFKHILVNQNVKCTQYVVKHNLVLDGMLIY